MKNIILIWLLLLGSLCRTGYAAEKTLVFSGIQGAVNSEISLQVLREAYQQLGIAIEYRPLPGERALRTSNSGEVDGEVFRIANVQRKYKNLIPVPTTINVLQGSVFSKDKTIAVDGWESLRPYTIGIQLGIKFVERGTKGFKIIAVDTNEQVFKMLQSDRVEIAVVAYTNGLKTIKNLNLTDIYALRPALKEYPLYHYLHKKHIALVPKINRVIKQMQASGRVMQIRNEHINTLTK